MALAYSRRFKFVQGALDLLNGIFRSNAEEQGNKASHSHARTQTYESCEELLCRVRRLLVTANAVPSSPILVTLVMEALRSSETSVLTRTTRRNMPEDGFPQMLTSPANFLSVTKNFMFDSRRFQIF
jgi:hypothetical protein